MGAKSAPKTTKWGQKAPPHKSEPKKCGGKKCRQNAKVGAKSATTQIRENKVMVAECAIKMEKWWRKTPLKQQSDGKKCHHISNCGGTLTTTYHIQGAGAPAKTENHVNADAFIFFREKVRPFPHLAKPVNTIFRKDEEAMVQIKRDWFNTEIFIYERGWHYGRWKEKIQI